MKKIDLSVLSWFATLAVVLVVLFGLATYLDTNREWMETQHQYNDVMEGRWEKARLQAESAHQPAPAAYAAEPIAIHQINAVDLRRVDRCTTCHVGIDDKSFANANQPFKTHPNLDLITLQHPSEKYGCTSCHHGQGMATTAEGAHGFIHKWDYPMLGDREHLTKYVQASCAQCHVDPTKWAAIGAPKLARGAQIVKEKNCASCHRFGTEGGSIGPELTYEGDKVPDQFNFDRLKDSLEAGTYGDEGKKAHIHDDIVTWHYYHFKNPQAVSSGSVMPNFGFSDDDLDALITYIMSRQHRVVPAAYPTDDAKITAAAVQAAVVKPAAAAPAVAPKKMSEADLKANGQKVFTANCASCHQATGLGLPGTFPPLAGSEYTNGDAKRHIGIVLKGLNGPVTVGGKSFNGVMPPFNTLSDEDLASVVTYERTAWGNHGSVVKPEDVKAAR